MSEVKDNSNIQQKKHFTLIYIWFTLIYMLHWIIFLNLNWNKIILDKKNIIQLTQSAYCSNFFC